MDRGVHRVDFDGRYDVEAGLLEAQAKPTGTGEKIDS
jgi:hypothetical protein